MKITALTTDGTWWTIQDEGFSDVLDRDEFFARWFKVTSDSLIYTSDPDTCIQKCNIIALDFEE